MSDVIDLVTFVARHPHLTAAYGFSVLAVAAYIVRLAVARRRLER